MSLPFALLALFALSVFGSLVGVVLVLHVAANQEKGK